MVCKIGISDPSKIQHRIQYLWYLNLSFNLDFYDLLEDISDPGRIAAELLRRGKQIEIPEVLYPMLDFERIRDS